jgi:hypothetical protein
MLASRFLTAVTDPDRLTCDCILMTVPGSRQRLPLAPWWGRRRGGWLSSLAHSLYVFEGSGPPASQYASY